MIELAIAVAVIVGVAIYLHTAAGKALEVKLQAQAESLKASFTSLEGRLGLIHAAALAPVSVTVVPTAVAPQATNVAPVATVDHAAIINAAANVVAAATPAALTSEQSRNLLIYGSTTAPTAIATPAAPAVAAHIPDFFAGDSTRFTIVSVDAPPQSISGSSAAGTYQVLCQDAGSEAGETTVSLSQGGVVLVAGYGTSVQDTHVVLDGTPCSFSVVYRPGSVSDSVLAQRVAAGQGISQGIYQLRKIA